MSPGHFKNPHYSKNTKHLMTEMANGKPIFMMNLMMMRVVVMMMMTMTMMRIMMIMMMIIMMMMMLYLSDLFDGLKGIEERRKEVRKDRQEVDNVHEALYKLPSDDEVDNIDGNGDGGDDEY